jgi:hypothetical protein
MSVQTTADERRDEAKELIKKAYKCLQEALDEDTWGSQDYKDEYIETMEDALVTLRKLQRKL